MGLLRITLSCLGIAVIGLTAAQGAFAQQRYGAAQLGPAPWYVGVGAGVAYYHLRDQDFNVPSLATNQGTDETGFGWKVFGGYRFTPNFGLEGAYVDLGKSSGTGNFSAHSWNLSAVGRIPFASGFSLQGKLGASFNRAQGFNDTHYRTGVLVGAGVGYDFPNGFGVLAEYEYFGRAGDATTVNPTTGAVTSGTGRADLHLFSVSGLVRF